ncbi:MAG: type I DNA topoisomerase [Pseudomonadota bacterium]
MAASNLVIVESPAKAKTIEKYLGADYKVLASYGHIRDLPPKDGSVRPDDGFSMDWELGDRAGKTVKDITAAMKGAQRLYLATDPDREGEAISWHVEEVLRDKELLQDKEVHRITFNEITKRAVQDAIAQPRQVDDALVQAYLARRALDYLVGFTLSPVLWRKLPGSKSAGRVQSVALRLICEREAEIEIFKPVEYWSIQVDFTTDKGEKFTGRLTHADGKKLDKLSIGTEAEAKALADRIAAGEFTVSAIEKKQTKRNPYAPFTTSTLQQDASRRLGLGASQTMRLAQQLYEGVDIGGETVGLITYMRTDGIQLSQDAINQSRSLIKQDYGDTYVPDSPRIYKSKQKNAQEAHEAIRPTDLARRPGQMRQYLNPEQLKLYDLIWKRTMASQMASAVLDQAAVDLTDSKGELTLRATGSIVAFDGFLKLYQETRDEDSEDEQSRRLPALNKGDKPNRDAVKPDQHFTQPPPRYSEASLVKKLEELGIGRPSTYASIMQVLQDRSYVVLDKRRFVPEDRGRMVTAFLSNFFTRYVEYDFTANLEEQLDDISGGRAQWQEVLTQFWDSFSGAIEGTKDLKISDVIDVLDENLGPHFFPPRKDGVDPRVCPSCSQGRLSLKLGRTGGFIGCSRYPECKYTTTLAVQDETSSEGVIEGGQKLLGEDPETGLPVTLRQGPYGTYVQLGPSAEQEAAELAEAEAAAAEGKKKKPKSKLPKPPRASLPKEMTPNSVDLDIALQLLALPRDVGMHPESEQMITAGIGRYGPYLKLGSTYQSLPSDDTVLTIGINHAVELMAQKLSKSGGKPAGLMRELGNHPDDEKPITLNNGRFGPYVKYGKVMASLTKSDSPDDITLDRALELIAIKAEKMAAKAGGKTAAKKKAPAKKKTTAKKKTATKTKKSA